MAHKPADQSSERDALLRAVCAFPDDDPPRLAYADLLERSDMPIDRARADFIRVQCAQTCQILDDEQWEEFRNREKELNEMYREEWMNELPDLDGVLWHSDFRRGFVWGVSCKTVEAFSEHAIAIFDSAPIRSLGIHKVRTVHGLEEIPQLLRITRLILIECRLGADGAQALAQSPNVANLTNLHLSGNRIGDAGAMALAASAHLRRLRDLDLSENGISDFGVIAMAQSPITASLEHLGLAGSRITDAGAEALARSPHLRHITGLTLWECEEIGTKGKALLQTRFGDAVSFCD